MLPTGNSVSAENETDDEPTITASQSAILLTKNGFISKYPPIYTRPPGPGCSTTQVNGSAVSSRIPFQSFKRMCEDEAESKKQSTRQEKDDKKRTAAEANNNIFEEIADIYDQEQCFEGQLMEAAKGIAAHCDISWLSLEGEELEKFGSSDENKDKN